MSDREFAGMPIVESESVPIDEVWLAKRTTVRWPKRGMIEQHLELLGKIVDVGRL